MKTRKGHLRIVSVLPFAWLALSTPGAAQTKESAVIKEASLFGASVGSGARALGMGGAFIAVADDATASSWNPAGLCVLEKPEASFVGRAQGKFTTDYAPYTYTFRSFSETYDERGDLQTISQKGRGFEFASVTYPFRAGSLKVVPQLNYQRAVDLSFDPTSTYAFGWNDVFLGFPSRAQHTGTIEGDFSGGLDVYAISLGLGFTPKIYLGATLNLWRKGSDGTRTTRETENYSDPFGTDNFTFTRVRTSNETFKGTNFNAGILLKPTDKFRLGAVYKSRFDMSHDLEFTRKTTTAFSGGGSITSQIGLTENGTIKWPWTVGVGVAVLPTDVLTLSADYTTSKWSSADYDLTQVIRTTSTSGNTSVRTFTGTLLWPTLSNPARPEENFFNPFQRDTVQVRAGAEYVIKKPNFAKLVVLPLRVGFYTDRQYFKDTPNLGNVDFTGVTGGFGLVWSRLSLDFAYVHQNGKYRSGDFSRQLSFTETSTGQADDSFKSNRLYVSTTLRFK